MFVEESGAPVVCPGRAWSEITGNEGKALRHLQEH